MGRRGPAPKPTALRVVEGRSTSGRRDEVSHRPINASEPKPRPGIGACPDWLDELARAEWLRIVPELELIPGLLTRVDASALATYCLAFGQMRRAKAVLDRRGLTFTTPSGYRQQRPEVAIVNRCAALVKAFAAEFGLTPAARTRISTGVEQDDDELERLLS